MVSADFESGLEIWWRGGGQGSHEAKGISYLSPSHSFNELSLPRSGDTDLTGRQLAPKME